METLGKGSQIREVEEAIARTRQWLLSQQHAEGYWVAELEGDSILQSETILLLAFLDHNDSELIPRLARRLLETQLADGGWAMYPGGGVEISASVKAYFALKLAGHDTDSEPMVRARRAILAHGGADAVNSYTRFFLALLGQIPYSCCPAVPPEIVLLPRWFPVNLYAVSSWSRTIIVPLSIVSALQPVRQLEPERGIRELFLKDPRDWPPLRSPGTRKASEGCPEARGSEAPAADSPSRQARPPAPREPLLGWTRFFRVVDQALKWYQRSPWRPTRRRALRAAEQWMLARFERSDGLGAIFPPIVFSLAALRAMGYPDDGPEVQYCLRQLHDLVLEDADSGSARVQPCKSPVWDTAITVRALAAVEADFDEPTMQRAVEWLLDQQITRPGDWCENVNAEPGGWCFEFHNDFYPDADDTAMVLMALAEAFRVGGAARPANPKTEELLTRAAAAIDRGMNWLVAMQNDDGGWGAFDRNNDRQFLCHVPFADHNAMIDPSTPDLTARVLEALGRLGRRLGDAVVDRAVAYLREAQEPDGAWFGRWGVNYIYGTWQSLVGLTAVGVPREDPAVQAGARWLLAHQQPCGAWGESPDTYEQPQRRGQGPATPSQTAWAVMGLLAAGLSEHPAVARAVQWLVDQQRMNGTWNEPEFTGTGFPCVFYLRYHSYPIYFPLMALGLWKQSQAGAETAKQSAARAVAEPSESGPARPAVEVW